MYAEVGRRTHRVVAHLAASGEDATTVELLEMVREMWRRDPVGGSVASSARLRCSTAAAVYLHRFMPRGWTLIGHEVPVGRAVADLVWRSATGSVVIDEVKSGATSLDSPKVRNQVERLAAGGQETWPGVFAGVRLTPLGAPSRTCVVNLDGSDLRVVETPMGMELR